MTAFPRTTAVLLALALAPTVAGADEELDFSDETVRINYSLGYQIGGDFRRQGVEMDADAVVQGIADALAEGEPKMSREEMNATLMALKRRIVADAEARRESQGERMRRAGLEYLEQNKTKEGIQVTESGLQYRVIEEGAGASPGPEDTVIVDYEGTLISGQVFDSSRSRGEPATFRLDQVIPGWREGLQLMREGGIYQLFVPPELAYDTEGPMADQALIFEIELLEVEPGGAGESPASDEVE
jgi:FKBP-type peptidyl-prolyl cis-trans isomerase FklB